MESFARAADALHLTHGAISRAVRLLEDDLGVALFERRSRRVFLTDAGRRLAIAVRDGLDGMRQAVAQLRADAGQHRRWTLSCEPTLLMRWLIPRWSDFQARVQDAQVHLVAGGGPFSFAGGIDLAIRRNDFPWPGNCHAEPLFAEQVGPVCRPDKVDAWFVHTTAGLALKPGAVRLETQSRPDAWQAWAAAANHPLQGGPTHGFDHFYFSLQAAVAGLGVAIGPWHLVRDDLDSGTLVAPLGFVEDGSRYCLLAPQPLQPGGTPAQLLAWLRTMA